MTLSDATTIYAADPSVEINEVPDGYVIYQQSRDRVHFLNPTAVAVYELCAEGLTAADIEAYLQETLDLPQPPSDMVEDCIGKLLTEALIHPRNSEDAA